MALRSNPAKFNKEFQTRRKDNGSSSRCGIVLVIAWILILSWIGFLTYCWYSGAIDQDKINNLANNVDTIIVNTEESFLRRIHSTTTSGNPAGQHTSGIVAKQERDRTDDVWIVFSTDCSAYQDWQTLLLFHSAKVVGQKGKVTRIASGCTEQQQQTLTTLYKQLYGDEYGAHFTPDFKRDAKTNRSYDFYNKPWGLKHWLEYASPPIPDHAVIALLDPDMVLVRPITPFVANQPHIVNPRIPKDEIMERIVAGKPVSQTYGLGAPWTNDNHKHFKRGRICGEGSPCLLPSQPYGELHYSVGPPYVVEKSDFIKIADSWTRLVPRVYEGYPYLLAEMYAYSMAAAHEKLPHLQVDHYMVSNVDAGGEGWPWVDQLSEVCVPPEEEVLSNGEVSKVTYYPGQALPTVVHYCQSFRAGEFGFFKRRVPKDIFSCESDLLLEPPTTLAHSDYIIKKNEKQAIKNARTAKRNAYILCIVYHSLNLALKDFKRQLCPRNASTSLKETIVFRGG